MDIAESPKLEVTLYNQSHVESCIASLIGQGYNEILMWNKDQQNPYKDYMNHVSAPSNVEYFPMLRFSSKSAELYGLQTLEQLCRLESFLQKKGKYQLVPVQKRGACMFASFRKCVKCPPGFTNTHLRRYLIWYLTAYSDFFMNQLKEFIAQEYGVEIEKRETDGPFSYRTYLEYMLHNDSWGDQAILLAMSMIFGVRITVLNAQWLTQTRIRHTNTLKETDVVLVFCGGNHYVPAVKNEGSQKEIDAPEGVLFNIAKEDPSVYSDEEDAVYKESAIMGFEKLRSTCQKRHDDASDMLRNTYFMDPCYSSVRRMYGNVNEETSATGDNISSESKVVPETGDSTAHEEKVVPKVEIKTACEDSTVHGMEGTFIPKDNTVPVQQILPSFCQDPGIKSEHKIVTYSCRDCEKYFITKLGLLQHRTTKHSEGKLFHCPYPKCGKGFPSKGKLNAHSYTHMSVSEKIQAGLQCKNCCQIFTQHRNLKVHIRKCYT